MTFKLHDYQRAAVEALSKAARGPVVIDFPIARTISMPNKITAPTKALVLAPASTRKPKERGHA